MNIYEDYNRAKKVNRQLAITLISHQTVACFSQGLYQVCSCYTTYMYAVVEASNVINDPKCNKGPKCRLSLSANFDAHPLQNDFVVFFCLKVEYENGQRFFFLLWRHSLPKSREKQ